MREIKFRAWDQSCNVMVIQSSRRIRPVGNLSEQAREYNFILMQYTGLKDRNGVEIYEGDILQCRSAPGMPTVVFWNNELSQYDHKFCGDGGFVTEGFRFLDLSDEEVIGNIHENPELLEES